MEVYLVSQFKRLYLFNIKPATQYTYDFLFLPGYVDVVKSKHIPKDGVLWTTLLYGTGPGYDWGLRSNRTKRELGTNFTIPTPTRPVKAWAGGGMDTKNPRFEISGLVGYVEVGTRIEWI